MSEGNVRKRTGKRLNKKKWSNKKKVIVSALSIFIVIMTILLLGYGYVRGKIYTKNNSSNIVSENNYKEVEGITNVLLIGIDARSLDEHSRSDSILIATLDNNNKKIKLTSLFRDTLVDIPGYGEQKLNAAYALGGPELLLKTVSDTYEINIDKYVVINFWGFEAIIDQIGGIEVDVKDYQLEELNKYIGESTGGNDCPVTEAGLQVLNGKQALSYARIRKGVGDEFERTSRQQEVILKVAEKLRETKPSKYLGIMNKMLDYIKTNIEPIQALNMAYTIYKFPSLATEQLQIPIPDLAEGRLYKDLGWVFLMDRKQNAQILNDFIFEDKIPNPEEYDLYSLYQALAQYAADEDAYNSANGINPEDYEEVDKLPEVEEQPYDGNVEEPGTGGNQGGNPGGNQGGTEGGNQGGTEGGNQGGTEGGNQGGTDGGNQGGTEGGNQGGTEGGNQGGTDGGNQGGTEGGNQGGTDGENQGGADGGNQDGTTQPPEVTNPPAGDTIAPESEHPNNGTNSNNV